MLSEPSSRSAAAGATRRLRRARTPCRRRGPRRCRCPGGAGGPPRRRRGPQRVTSDPAAGEADLTPSGWTGPLPDGVRERVAGPRLGHPGGLARGRRASAAQGCRQVRAREAGQGRGERTSPRRSTTTRPSGRGSLRTCPRAAARPRRGPGSRPGARRGGPGRGGRGRLVARGPRVGGAAYAGRSRHAAARMPGLPGERSSGCVASWTTARAQARSEQLEARRLADLLREELAAAHAGRSASSRAAARAAERAGRRSSGAQPRPRPPRPGDRWAPPRRRPAGSRARLAEAEEGARVGAAGRPGRAQRGRRTAPAAARHGARRRAGSAP